MIRSSLFLLAGFFLVSLAQAAYAQTDDRQAVESAGGNIVRNSYGNCVRTMWTSEGDVCAPAAPEAPPTPPKPVVAAKPPAPVKHTVISEAARTVYFPFNKAELTDEAKEALDTLAETLKAATDIQEAKIVGTADRIGSVNYNDKLSQKRAEAVRDYLIARGYTNASVTKTRWVGKSEPITNCSKKLRHKKLVACLHKDRRVQIEIVYRSEVTTSAPPSPTAPHTPVKMPAPTKTSVPAIPMMPVR